MNGAKLLQGCRSSYLLVTALKAQGETAACMLQQRHASLIKALLKDLFGHGLALRVCRASALRSLLRQGCGSSFPGWH